MCTASIKGFGTVVGDAFKKYGPSIATGMQISGVGSQVFGAYRGAQAEQASAEYQAAIDDNNAKIAGWNAQDSLARGTEMERRSRLRTRADKGSFTASAAARGLDVSEGSALNILTDIDMVGEEDALTIRNNANREAWGYGVQRDNYSRNASLMRGRADAISPIGAAASTLLTGAGQVASSWYRGAATRTGAA